MNVSNRLAAALVAASLATLAGVAQAQQAAPAPAGTSASTLSFQQVIDRITSQGYADVREVERKSDKLYEIKARDGKGQRVELYVDARSGEVLKQDYKDKP